MEWEKILIAVITAVVPVLAGFLSTWLKSLYDNNKIKIKNEKAQVTLGLVTDMIVAAVETTTGTYVKELKKAGTFVLNCPWEVNELNKMKFFKLCHKII